MSKASFAHIVNIVNFPREHSLSNAQQITLRSMEIAKQYAEAELDVSLYSAQYEEDIAIVPRSFIATPNLERSVLDFGKFTKPQKLPLVVDILERLSAASNAEYFIFTNIDIAVMPSFYVTVQKLLERGDDALFINRRTISEHYVGPEQLPLMFAEIGSMHPGTDCFVFKSSAYKNYILGNECVGKWCAMKSLNLNMNLHAQSLKTYGQLHLTFHLGDDRGWQHNAASDYALYNMNEYFSARKRCEKLISSKVGMDPDWIHKTSEKFVREGYHRLFGKKDFFSKIRGMFK